MRSMWLERESGGGGSGASGGGAAAKTAAAAPRETASSRAAAKAATEKREKAAETPVRAVKTMSADAIAKASDRLYRGESGVAKSVKTTTAEAETSFAPKISEASRRLAKKYREKQRTNDAKPAASDRASTLPTREREELKELESCTFAPNISRRSREISASLYKKKSGSFVERSRVWAQRKEAILEAEREAKVEDDLRDCTFAPKISAPGQTSRERRSTTILVDDPESSSASPAPATPSSSGVMPKGLESFLARQQSARKQREEKNALANRLDGSTWKHETTTSEPFTFATASKARHQRPRDVKEDVKVEANAATPTQRRPPKSPAYVAARERLRGVHLRDA